MLRPDRRATTWCPYFFATSPTGRRSEYVGAAARWDDEVVRGSIDDGEFTSSTCDGERVVGALSVGRSDDLDAARRLIREHVELGDRARSLGDVDVELPTF